MPTVTGTSSGGGIKKIQRGTVYVAATSTSKTDIPINSVNTEKSVVRTWFRVSANHGRGVEGTYAPLLTENNLRLDDAVYHMKNELGGLSATTYELDWEVTEYV